MTIVQQTFLAFAVFAAAQWNISKFAVCEPFPLNVESMRGQLTRKRYASMYRCTQVILDISGAVTATFSWLSMAIAEYSGGTVDRYERLPSDVVHPSQLLFSFYFVTVMAHAFARMSVSAAVWNNIHSDSRAIGARVLTLLSVLVFLIASVACVASQLNVSVGSTEAVRDLCATVDEFKTMHRRPRCESAVVALSVISSSLWLYYAFIGMLCLTSLYKSTHFGKIQ